METKRIGMELSYLSAIDMDLMHRELPHAEIVNAAAEARGQKAQSRTENGADQCAADGQDKG